MMCTHDNLTDPSLLDIQINCRSRSTPSQVKRKEKKVQVHRFLDPFFFSRSSFALH
uniref:Uncharacterized protein n=1 Tax=Setaria italica TaxID=4555 RepID=K4A4L1_SETIT